MPRKIVIFCYTAFLRTLRRLGWYGFCKETPQQKVGCLVKLHFSSLWVPRIFIVPVGQPATPLCAVLSWVVLPASPLSRAALRRLFINIYKLDHDGHMLPVPVANGQCHSTTAGCRLSHGLSYLAALLLHVTPCYSMLLCTGVGPS